MLTNGATTVLHVPVWLRVLPTTPTADVLLVDDDGSTAGAAFADYSAVYTSTLDALGRQLHVPSTCGTQASRRSSRCTATRPC